MSPEIIQRLKNLNTRMLNITAFLLYRHGRIKELTDLEKWLNDDYERLTNGKN